MQNLRVMHTVFCCIDYTLIIHCATFGDLNQVVDLGSTWKALSPKLSSETRPLVLKAIAELLSLVPTLRVKTEQYEVRLHFLQFLQHFGSILVYCFIFYNEVLQCSDGDLFFYSLVLYRILKVKLSVFCGATL